MQGSAMVALRAGITTVRDLGAPTDLAVALREAIRSGLVAGPDLLVSGAPVTTTGGHCWFIGGEADGELGVRVAVRERVKAGVDWIKVMASGGNMTPGSNVFAAQYSVTELRALIEEPTARTPRGRARPRRRRHRGRGRGRVDVLDTAQPRRPGA
jgi:imidazolonepropionase-like amidohydrolase